jgi:tetratricopeptide (TPR) repeat protein
MRGAVSIQLLALLVTGAAAQSPSDVDTCNGKGRRSPDSQIAGCTTLLESDVDNPQINAIAHNNRGNAYTAKGEYDHAIQDYDESIRLNPNFARALNNRGVAYLKTGDYERAIQDFDGAIKIDPSYADAFANRAESNQKKGDYPSALKDFDAAIQLKPALSVLWNERCWTRALAGQLEDAMADCNQSIRLEPNAAAFDSRGFTYLKLGQWELAITDYNSALRIDPRLATALYGRGFAKLKTEDRAGGSADTATAQAIDHNVAEEFSRYGIH